MKILKTLLYLVLFLVINQLCAQNIDLHHHCNHDHSQNELLDSLSSDVTKDKLLTTSVNTFLQSEEKYSLEPLYLASLEIPFLVDEKDINCSGGFCFDSSHKHRKGLSEQKQLFFYFIKVGC